MTKLTVEIPDGTHHHIRMIAASRGITIKEYVLDKLLPELEASENTQPTLRELANQWEQRKSEFKLERGNRGVREIFHEDHKW